MADESQNVMPARPSHGTMGRPIKLQGNYFAVQNKLNSPVYQYMVSYDPETGSRGQRTRLLYVNQDAIGTFVYDGGAMVFTKKQIDNSTFVVENDRNPDQGPWKITLTYTATLQPDSPQIIQLFNVIFRKIIRQHLKMQPLGRNHFTPELSEQVPQHKIELWPGFSTSIVQQEAGLMINIDLTYKVLHTDSVYDFMRNLMNRSRGRFQQTAEAELLGQIVMTRYNNRTYHIDEIDWKQTPKSTFKKGDKDISYLEYYSTTYNRTIQDPDQPLLVVKVERKGQPEAVLFLIPELCYMTGITEEMRADFRVMKDLNAHTCVVAPARRQRLVNFMKHAVSQPDVAKDLAAWDLTISPEMTMTDGMQLPRETILLANNKRIPLDDRADWSAQMRSSPVLEPAHLESWVVVYPQFMQREAQEFSQMLHRVGGPFGIRVNKPVEVMIPDDQINSYVSALKRSLNPSVQFVMIMLSTPAKNRYDAIKQQCVLADRTPVPSQCIVKRTLKKNAMSVATKVILQICAKRGGQLWAVEIPFNQRVMVIGIDVCHTKGSKSCLGFCASLNKTLTRYWSMSAFMAPGQEIAESLQLCLGEALRVFGNLHKALPDRIIVYRDGVGKGQLAAVTELEVASMKMAFKHFEQYDPVLSVIVVNKRINTRLFTQQGNPPPGTVCDKGISSKSEYDFYLVSQNTRIGTVSPCKYHVVYETVGRALAPQFMQALTYKACHLYYNWQGTVAVPAPVMYAHKLAFLHGQSLHNQSHTVLRDKLYYL